MLRRGLVVVDQGVAALFTLIGSVAAARQLSPNDFGLFALILFAVTLAIGLFRACNTDIVLMSVGMRAFNATRARALRVGLLLSCFAGILMGLLVLGVRGFDRPLVVLAIALVGPFVFVQDMTRWIFIASGKRLRALELDVATLFLIVLFTFIIKPGSHWDDFLLSWLLGPILPSGIALISIRRWFRNGRSQAIELPRRLALGADYSIGAAALQVPLWTASLAISPIAAAALRGSDTLLGPLRVIITAVQSLLLAQFSHSFVRRRPWVLVLVSSISLQVIASGWVVAVVLIPDSLGREILGRSWQPALAVLPFIGVGYVSSILTTISAVALKVSGSLKTLLALRIATAVVGISMGLYFGLSYGAKGVAISAMSVSIVASLVWFSRVIKLPLREIEDEGYPLAAQEDLAYGGVQRSKSG